MVIPKGYKQTDVGVIPEDWGVKSIGELFKISGGYPATRADLSNNGYFYLHYGDIHSSKKTYLDTEVDKNQIPRLNINLKKISQSSLLEDGDVVFVDASEDDEGASRHIVVRNKQNIPFISGLHTIVAKSLNNDLNKQYRQFCFQTENVKQQFKHYSAGTKVTGISKKTIQKITILIPPKSEQAAIANVLTHIDELIASLRKLIEKKRAVKQGAMQELLTGKKRLPGFKGKWETVQLKKISTLSSGGTPLTSINTYYTGNIPFMNISDISNSGKYLNNTEKYITEDAVANSSAYKFPPNMLLFAMYASIGKCAINTVEMTCSQAILCINPIKINLEYLYYNFVNREKEFLGMRQTGTQNNLNKIIMGNVIIPYPSYEEQSAIADILTNMDNEIEQLEQKLAKYEKIKIGMMQNLLTGKIRLPTT